jgi:hypothetical protein
MPNKLTLELTDEQQKQIRESTGENITKVTFNLAAKGELTENQLGQVVGGAVNAYLIIDGSGESTSKTSNVMKTLQPSTYFHK